MRRLSNIVRATLLCSCIPVGLANAKEIKVEPGQSIQAAITSAKPGDQITVTEGSYAEQLTINKDGIKLVGQKGAILSPPASFVTNGCTGLVGDNTQAGICVIGSNPQLGDVENGEHRKFISVDAFVKDVLVKGLEIHGFDGLDIAVVGAQNAEVRDNTVLDGTHYGILTVGSKNTVITNNTVDSSVRNFIGICMDDQSDVSVTRNIISHYKVGLCVQTSNANVGHNKVEDCCVGIYVDPLIDSAHVMDNEIVGTKDQSCLQTLGIIAGVILDGAVNTDLQHNDISGVSDSGVPDTDYVAPAIWIYDFSGPVASGNKVDYNKMSDNDYNVLNSSAGSNEIKHNKCNDPSSNCNF